MHLFKLVACCQRECEVVDSRYHWLYMCAAAKSVTNSAGAGRRVLEAAAPLLGLPSQGPAYTTEGGGPGGSAVVREGGGGVRQKKSGPPPTDLFTSVRNKPFNLNPTT